MNRIVQLLLISVMVMTCQSLNPVGTVSLQQQALVPVLDLVIPMAKIEILKAVIPAISDSSSFYSLQLQNLKVTNVIIPTGDITVGFSNGMIQVNVVGVEVDVVGDAHISALFISSNGVLTLKVQNIQFSMELSDTMDSNNRLIVAANNVAVNTGNIDISITGDIGASILNLFTSFLKSTVQSTIISEATAAVQTTFIPLVNQKLAALPYDIIIPNTPFSAHFNPTGPVLGNNGMLSASLNAYTFLTASPSLPNIPAPVDMTGNVQNAYLQALLSDYALNSIFYTIQQSGITLSVNQTLVNLLNITSLDNFMNTDNFDTLIPGFVNAFGANSQINLVVSSVEQASFAITEPSVSASINLHVDIQIQDSTMAYVTMGYVQAAFQLTTTGQITNQVVIAQILSATCTSQSTDHPFLTANINDLVSKSMTSINTFLANGIPIPTIPQGQLTQTSLVLHNGYVEVQSSFLATPTVALAQIITVPATHLIQRCLNIRNFKNKFVKFFLKNSKKINKLYKYQLAKTN